MSASKQRYSIWIGKKKAPIDSAEAIEQMLKDQRYQFEMHTRNWNQGGYIVSCLILYINVFLFPLTPNVSGFFLCPTFLISTFQFQSGLQGGRQCQRSLVDVGGAWNRALGPTHLPPFFLGGEVYDSRAMG